MTKLKTYKIRYKQTLGWNYVVKNPDDLWDYDNYNDANLVSCDFEDSVKVEAASKGEAKAMFTVAVAMKYFGDPVPVLPIIRNAYRGIIDIAEVEVV